MIASKVKSQKLYLGICVKMAAIQPPGNETLGLKGRKLLSHVLTGDGDQESRAGFKGGFHKDPVVEVFQKGCLDMDFGMFLSSYIERYFVLETYKRTNIKDCILACSIFSPHLKRNST